MPDRDCTLACVRGGSKFALVVDGKVFQIANQDLDDLKTHAGHTVMVTGELEGSDDYGIEDRDAVGGLAALLAYKLLNSNLNVACGCARFNISGRTTGRGPCPPALQSPPLPSR